MNLLSHIRKWFWLIPAILIVVQQWVTYAKYSDKFENIKEYTKSTWGSDFISGYAKRFPELRTYFISPAHMGYCSEPNQDKPNYYLHYVLTQYNLAPNLITERTDSDTILYNLYVSKHLDPLSNFHLQHGWHVLKDFNNGFILICK